MREKFKHKLCFKKKYTHLNLKHTPSYALTTRLLKNGKFLKTYKLLKYFFYKIFLLKNFNKIPSSSAFLYFYNKYQSFRDLDRVLFWKYNQLDCMFSFKVRRIKKKKKILTNLIFITGNKRLLLAINFLKYIILLSVKKNGNNMIPDYFLPLGNFLSKDRDSVLIKIKYRIYKKKLAKMRL